MGTELQRVGAGGGDTDSSPLFDPVGSVKFFYAYITLYSLFIDLHEEPMTLQKWKNTFELLQECTCDANLDLFFSVFLSSHFSPCRTSALIIGPLRHLEKNMAFLGACGMIAVG